MGFAAKAYRRMLFQMVLIQAALISLLLILEYLFMDIGSSLALLYGGLVVIIAMLISAWRFMLLTNPDKDLEKNSSMLSVAELYKGTVLRFVLVIALLTIGMVALKLEPLAVVIGFCVTQISYFFGSLTSRWGQQ